MAPPKNDKDAYLRYRYWVHFEEGEPVGLQAVAALL